MISIKETAVVGRIPVCYLWWSGVPDGRSRKLGQRVMVVIPLIQSVGFTSYCPIVYSSILIPTSCFLPPILLLLLAVICEADSQVLSEKADFHLLTGHEPWTRKKEEDRDQSKELLELLRGKSATSAAATTTQFTGWCAQQWHRWRGCISSESSRKPGLSETETA